MFPLPDLAGKSIVLLAARILPRVKCQGVVGPDTLIVGLLDGPHSGPIQCRSGPLFCKGGRGRAMVRGSAAFHRHFQRLLQALSKIARIRRRGVGVREVAALVPDRAKVVNERFAGPCGADGQQVGAVGGELLDAAGQDDSAAGAAVGGAGGSQ